MERGSRSCSDLAKRNASSVLLPSRMVKVNSNAFLSSKQLGERLLDVLIPKK